jgi:hypothetical protein
MPALEPQHTPLGARLRERTQPLAPDDAAYGYAHAYLCEALGRMLEQVQEVFDPEGDVPPFAPVLDVELCPDWALPWLAQLVGVVLPVDASPDDARVLISDVAGFSRGTPAALEAAAGLYLTGDKTVYFRERDPTGADPPYTLEVVTVTSETPDPAAVLRALLAQKPGGIVLNYRTVAGWDYQAMTTEGGLYSALAARFTSYRRMSNNERG